MNIVIIGAGMAGSRCAIKLAESYKFQGNESLTITLISKEQEVGYNRIMLSPVLAGEKSFEETYLYEPKEYESLGVKILAGVSVDDIDTQNQQLTLDNDETISYDKLVIATGSTARIIPFPNHDAKGVHVFRDVNDVTLLTEYAKQGKKGLVIGGGVLGLEAACALSLQGASMTVIHVDDFVLNRQLDMPAALMLQDELASRQVNLELTAITSSIEVDQDHNVIGLKLDDDRIIPADFIVMAVGIVPNTKVVKDTEIKVNRGIVVDKYMQTNCKNIYAIGECVEINEELFGMVSSVNQHVDTLTSVLCNCEETEKWYPFKSVPLALKLKVSGIAVFSAGQISFSEEEMEDIEQIAYRFQENSSRNDQYNCLYIKENKLVGAVLYGETSEGGFYSQLVNEKTDISAFKDSLIYGEAFCKELMKNSIKDLEVEPMIVSNHDIDPDQSSVVINSNSSSDTGEVA